MFSVDRTDLQKVLVDLSLRRVDHHAARDHHSSVDLLSSQAGAAKGKVTAPGKPEGSKLAKAARKAFSTILGGASRDQSSPMSAEMEVGSSRTVSRGVDSAALLSERLMSSLEMLGDVERGCRGPMLS